MRNGRGWAGRVAAFFGSGSEPLDTGITLEDVVREARRSGLPLVITDDQGNSYQMFADSVGLKISAPDGTTITLMVRTP